MTPAKRGGRPEPLDDILDRLSEATLRRLLSDSAILHFDVERAIRMAGSGPAGRLEALRIMVETELHVDDYLDYRDSEDWADDAQPVVAALSNEINANPSRELLEIIQDAIGQSVEALQRGDDSSGSLGEVMEQFLELHLQLCRKGVADGPSLARWLAKFMFEDQDWVRCDPVVYADALGDEGFALFRELLDEYKMREPMPWNARATRERLAILSGDIDQLVDTIGGDLSTASQYTHLSAALLEIGRPDDALAWAMRGLDAMTGWQVEDLFDIAAAVLTERGDLRGLLELRGNEHERLTTVQTYKQVREASVAVGTWPGPREYALEFLTAKNRGGLVDVLMDEGEVDRAWDAATAGDWNVGHERWIRLAQAREATHPGDAMNAYLALVETTLEKANTSAYPEGVWLLKSAQRAAKAAMATPHFDAYVESLRERYRRRPSLMSQLDRAKLR